MAYILWSVPQVLQIACIATTLILTSVKVFMHTIRHRVAFDCAESSAPNPKNCEHASDKSTRRSLPCNRSAGRLSDLGPVSMPAYDAVGGEDTPEGPHQQMPPSRALIDPSAKPQTPEVSLVSRRPTARNCRRKHANGKAPARQKVWALQFFKCHTCQQLRTMCKHTNPAACCGQTQYTNES